jgi:glucuronyl/N-acetylglucosaminyl transferase EXT1
MTSFTPLFGARNHLLFNLYSGSWPQYRELDFSFGHNYGPIAALLDNGLSPSLTSSRLSSNLFAAILVKASQSRQSYRPDFDVSLPLFARNHPTRGPAFSPNTRLPLDANTRTVSQSQPSP